MPYTITHSDGSAMVPPLVVADMTVDTTSTSLTLVGRAYANYGQNLNENMVKLLENFSSASSPTAPLLGQLWYNKTTRVISLYDGNGATGYEALATQAWVTSTVTGSIVSTSSFVGSSQNPVTLSGDATGSMGDTVSRYDIPVVLASVGTAGTYTQVVVDAKGRVTKGTTAVSAGNQTITLTGDATGSGTTSLSVALIPRITNAGTYGNNATTGSIAPWFSVAANGLINGVGSCQITPASIGALSLSTTGNLVVPGSITLGTVVNTSGYYGEIDFKATGGGTKIYYDGTSLCLSNANSNPVYVTNAGALVVPSNIIVQNGSITANTGGIFARGSGITSDGDIHVGSGVLWLQGVSSGTEFGEIIFGSVASGSPTVGSTGGSGVVYATGTNGYTCIQTLAGSDKKLKKNISPLSDGLSVVNATEVVNFEYRKDTAFFDGKQRVGFIAQDLVEHVPNAVMNFDDTLHVSKEELIPYLTRAVQQLSEMNDKLMARIEVLEAKLGN